MIAQHPFRCGSATVFLSVPAPVTDYFFARATANRPGRNVHAHLFAVYSPFGANTSLRVVRDS